MKDLGKCPKCGSPVEIATSTTTAGGKVMRKQYYIACDYLIECGMLTDYFDDKKELVKMWIKKRGLE